MARRWVRALIVIVTVLVTAGVIWRATRNEQARGRVRLASQVTDALAADVVLELWDLRSSMHAYVAPGQSVAFWSARARTQLASIRNRVDLLAPAVSGVGVGLDPMLNQLDALDAAEQRALAATQDGQLLVAGDIIFTEIRDHVDKAARTVSDARQALARAASSREAGAANEQSLLAGAVSALWIFALILLVPVPSAATTPARGTAAREEPDRLLLRDDPVRPAIPEVQPILEESVVAEPPLPGPSPATAVEPGMPATLATAGEDPSLLHELAALCVDVAQVSDARELGPLLERAATLAGAHGLVVWLASEDGQQLDAVMAHGYDPKALGRMGTIAVHDHNLTADAFRSRTTTQAAGRDGAPAALAVPLLTAAGASGVLAAEIADGQDLERSAAAIAIVGAQLATLFPGARNDEAVPGGEALAAGPSSTI